MSNGNHIAEQDLDLLALGALDESERRPLQEHLAGCAECSGQLAEARGRMALLAFAAPAVQPPASTREKLMQRVTATKPPVRAHQESRERKRGGWMLGWAALAFGLAAASVMLWVNNNRMDRELRLLQETTAEQQLRAIQNERLLDLFTAKDSIQVPLAPVAGHPGTPARVQYNQRRGLLMYAGNMPVLPAERSYELWLIPMTGNPINAGVFRPDNNGQAVVMFPALPAGVTPKAFAVTIEPAGGGPKPTGPMVQLGSAS
jgi:anti-sigma-K factor RskA